MPVYGFLANFGARRFPKGNEGKRVSSGYNRRRRLATRSSGKQQAERTAVRTAPDCLPRGKPSGAPVGIHLPLLGLDAPTPARTVGLPPRGGTTFFRSERKYQRKHAARRLQRRPAPLRVAGFGLREPFGLSSASVRCAHPPGKSPLMPIFERGSSQCRAQFSRRTNSCYRARSCSLFSSFKKGKAFSLRCLSPLCSAAA